jgi:hypothetical protein
MDNIIKLLVAGFSAHIVSAVGGKEIDPEGPLK